MNNRNITSFFNFEKKGILISKPGNNVLIIL